MKKLIFILMVGSLFMGCWTMQSLSQSSKVKAGMTTDEVRDIMGEPVMTELDRDVEEWHYCRYVINKDRYLAIFFVDNKVIAKNFYTREKGIKVEVYGSCEHFAKTGDYKVPPATPAQSSGSNISSHPTISKIDNNINFFILVLD